MRFFSSAVWEKTCWGATSAWTLLLGVLSATKYWFYLHGVRVNINTEIGNIHCWEGMESLRRHNILMGSGGAGAASLPQLSVLSRVSKRLTWWGWQPGPASAPHAPQFPPTSKFYHSAKEFRQARQHAAVIADKCHLSLLLSAQEWVSVSACMCVRVCVSGGGIRTNKRFANWIELETTMGTEGSTFSHPIPPAPSLLNSHPSSQCRAFW